MLWYYILLGTWRGDRQATYFRNKNWNNWNFEKEDDTKMFLVDLCSNFGIIKKVSSITCFKKPLNVKIDHVVSNLFLKNLKTGVKLIKKLIKCFNFLSKFVNSSKKTNSKFNFNGFYK